MAIKSYKEVPPAPPRMQTEARKGLIDLVWFVWSEIVMLYLAFLVWFVFVAWCLGLEVSCELKWLVRTQK